jgi:hypothetical protein
MTKMKRMEIDVELDTGEEHRVRVSNVSLVAFDRTRIKRGWPSADDAPMAWATFVAWHQMNAQGLVSCTFEEFEQTRCVVCRVVTAKDEDEGQGDDGLDPTRTIPAPPESSDLPSPPVPLTPRAEFLG